MTPCVLTFLMSRLLLTPGALAQAPTSIPTPGPSPFRHERPALEPHRPRGREARPDDPRDPRGHRQRQAGAHSLRAHCCHSSREEECAGQSGCRGAGDISLSLARAGKVSRSTGCSIVSGIGFVRNQDERRCF
jgi:hypothetical protein